MSGDTSRSASGFHRHLSGSPTAAALLSCDDLRVLWCNDHYLDMLPEPFRSDGVLGLELGVFSPVSVAMKAADLQTVAETGCCRHGTYTEFDVRRGSVTRRWSAYQTPPGHLLVLIDRHPEVPRSPAA